MPRKVPPFHPFLFAVYPILFLYSHNIGALYPNVAIAPLAVSIGITSAIFLILNIFLKDKQKTAIIMSSLILLFFSYGHVYQTLKGSSVEKIAAALRVSTDTSLLIIWAIALIICACYFARTRRNLGIPTYLCNVMALLLVVTSLTYICSYEFTRAFRAMRAVRTVTDDSAAERVETTLKERALPNIYYIGVDAYASEDVLKEFYGYDNSAFINYLKDKGFYVASYSTANYVQTGLSIASMLNMDYLDAVIGKLDPESNDTSSVIKSIKNSSVVRILRKNGYTIGALLSQGPESALKEADFYIEPGWAPDDFLNLLVNTTPIPVILSLFGVYDEYDLHSDRVIFKFKKLSDISALRQPFFRLAHIAVPHPPFVFGRNGERRKPGRMFQNLDGDSLIRRSGLTRQQYVSDYIDQLIFTNQKLQETIDAILSKPGKAPVIILQSDHGPRSQLSWKNPEKTNFRECMSILNAFYLPGAETSTLYGEITSVNTFRVIFNDYFGTDYEMLEDRNFFSNDRYPFRLIDVTGRVHEKQNYKTAAQ